MNFALVLALTKIVQCIARRKKKFSRARSSAVILQSFVRGSVARACIYLLHSAAMEAQRIWRSTRCRRKVFSYRTAKVEEESAVTVQRMLRRVQRQTHLVFVVTAKYNLVVVPTDHLHRYRVIAVSRVTLTEYGTVVNRENV